MNATPETTEATEYEGTWAEIQQHADKLNGRRLRVIVLPERQTRENDTRTPEERAASWLEFVRRFAVPGVVVDDSREAIYADEVERCR